MEEKYNSRESGTAERERAKPRVPWVHLVHLDQHFLANLQDPEKKTKRLIKIYYYLPAVVQIFSKEHKE